MRLFVLSLFCVLLLAAPRAMADCVSDCQASTYCGGSSWDCSQLLNTCYRGCQNAEPVSYPWGAFAHDEKSGAWGLSERSTSEARARKSALKFCKQNGEGCEIIKTFSNTCAVVAEDKAGTVAALGLDTDKQKVSEDANRRCNKKADNDSCTAARTTCYPE